MSNYGSGGSRAWRRARAECLHRSGGLCEIRAPGCTGVATTADHVIPLAVSGLPRNSPAACDPDGLQALCDHCHSVKTRAETNAGARAAAVRRAARRTRQRPHPGD